MRIQRRRTMRRRVGEGWSSGLGPRGLVALGLKRKPRTAGQTQPARRLRRRRRQVPGAGKAAELALPCRWSPKALAKLLQNSKGEKAGGAARGLQEFLRSGAHSRLRLRRTRLDGRRPGVAPKESRIVAAQAADRACIAAAVRGTSAPMPSPHMKRCTRWDSRT